MKRHLSSLALYCFGILFTGIQAEAQTTTGPSSSQSPYVTPIASGVTVTSILTAGDVVGSYTMCGIPDGTGVYDNGDGTFTLLVNHEFGNTVGVARAHGSTGAFVSKWVINKATLTVVSGGDLFQTVKLWNTTTSSYDTYSSSNPSNSARFARFCSADLPSVYAFYNPITGKGTQVRIFMNGEESGDEGRGMAHLVTGTEAGTSYELPYLGKLSWENSVACPYPSDKTIVAGFDDTGGGQVYIYVGTKSTTGTDIDKAGLSGGKLYGIKVNGLITESQTSVPAPGTAFTMYDLGDVHNTTGATIQTNSVNNAVTGFQRPEDGAWDPSNPRDLYFVTTNGATAPSRMWRLRFTDITNPELGGTIEAVLDGTEGQKMMDNIAIDHSGHVLIVEDIGGNAHIGKTWQYTIATDQMLLLAGHDETRFLTGGANFLTQDEETSGITDAQAILGPGMFLAVDQAHYPQAGQVVEGGQILAIYNPESATTLAEINMKGSTVNITDGSTTALGTNNTEFGSITSGTNVTRTFTIENTGAGSLSVYALNFGGTNASEFALVSPPTFPFTIAAGATQDISVKFTPAAIGNRTATMYVWSNDLDEGPYDFKIAGTAQITGPNSSQSPYLVPLASGVEIKSILTAGDVVGSYTMCGTPDGTGVYDNGDGTFTFLVNHEFGNTVGVARAHGSTGAFVSKWVINKTTLAVTSGVDLIQNVKLWNGTAYDTYNSSTPSNSARFARFCSADLPSVYAFYNPVTGKGTQSRIFMNGEESGDEGRGMGHIVTGTEAGTSYELPYLGKLSWENSVASPYPSDKTIVAGFDDTGGGQVYIYVGTKSNTGTDIDKAGLSGGKLYGIKVNGLITESQTSVPTAGTAFTMYDLGDVHNTTGATIQTNSVNNAVTGFQRPEDGAWDPSNPSDLYFVTTNGATAPSRMWRLRFTDITNPEAGGTIEAVLDGTEGQKMMDNIAIDHSGHVLIVEDIGGNAHIGKVWDYNISTDALTLVAGHDETRFLTGGANFLTQDEEASGITDAQAILGPGMFLVVDQAHYPQAGQVVEGGQFMTLYNPASAAAIADINLKGNSTIIANGDITVSATDNTNFGSVVTNNTTTKTFVIENTGTGALKVQAINFGGTNANEFTLVSAPTFPLTIAAGATETITVQFAPIAAGTRNATLYVWNNDADEGPYSFSVQGTASVASTVINPSTYPLAAVEVYPNPTSDNEVTVSVNMETSEQVMIRVYDSKGAEILAPVQKNLAVGNSQILLDISSLETGVYVVEISAGSKKIGVRTVVVR